MINTIGEWALKTSCYQNKQWQNIGLPKFRVAVNITGSQLKQPNIVKTIQDILQDSQLEAKYLELELTEKIVINCHDSIDKIIELKEMGVNIAMDDFGTGYSSLSYLKNLPLDRLKIDQSFIKNIDINKGDEIIIKAIISMAEDLCLEVLAEGVETQQQLDFLKSKRCGEVQGFYFSKPLSVSDLEIFLKDPYPLF